ncbi:hypothetical protein N431DRAFT_554906 [Stipitochalara longipes BDJ]|nr:hypothetical protein N431DRAFT_554906 [Stipitochalara longipes BDJ]
MITQRPRVEVTYPSRKDSDRPWLPGPPPDRQEILVEEAEADWDSKGLQDLQIPIHRIAVLAGSDFTAFLKAPLFEQAIPSATFPRGESTKILFHGCATKIDDKTLHSFSKMGPSIKFSRHRSYFSRQPAVYWTDSIEFTLAWCVFTKTGQWEMKYPPSIMPFECVIYIAEVNITSLQSHSSVYSIPDSGSVEDEQQLVDWCLANIDRDGGSSRISPPGSTISDWNILISRIPKHTRDSFLNNSLVAPENVYCKDSSISQAKLYATCDTETSYLFASHGIKIIHISTIRDNTNANIHV